LPHAAGPGATHRGGLSRLRGVRHPRPRVADLVLDYLDTFLAVPDLHIAARWHGTYAKHPTRPYVVARPAAEVTVVIGAGGAGMTLSFGLADRVVRELLGEEVYEDPG
jgi:hypothetical protein